MEIFDISLTISNDLPVWPGDPPIVIERVRKLEEGANANVSYLQMGAHVGTHVDAPLHFLKGGSTIDQMPLDVLVGPVDVVQLPDSVEVIDQAVLEQTGLPEGAERILFKTRNSAFWVEGAADFQTGFVGIDLTGSQYLVDRGVRLVGIDYLSISPFRKSKPTHEALLGAGIVIIEGLDLSKVSPGKYMLYCLPLKLGGAEGAPARAILTRG
jgi:arylformamidase